MPLLDNYLFSILVQKTDFSIHTDPVQYQHIMSKIVFKRLFEVQVFHEYYLQDKDGNSIFDLNANDRATLLENKILHKQYAAKREFAVKPTEATKTILRNHRLRFANTELGFVIGTETDVEVTDVDNIKYKPCIDIDPNVKLEFILEDHNAYLRSITNMRMSSAYPSAYFFSNKNTQEIDGRLPLSTNVLPFNASKTYEMGELAAFGGSIKEALENTNSSDPSLWMDITDHQYVNEADRTLLPCQFMYHFPLSNVQNATFVLKTMNNAVVKTVNVNKTSPFQRVPLNLSVVDEAAYNSPAIETGYYKLQVSNDVGLNIEHIVYIDRSLHETGNLGKIEIQLGDLSPTAGVLDADGYLKTRIVNGDKILHTIYELRFQARKVYWRYIAKEPFSASDVGSTAPFLAPVSNTTLVSQVPKRLSNTLIPIEDGGSVFMPMPKIDSIRFSSDKIYGNIYISNVNQLTDA